MNLLYFQEHLKPEEGQDESINVFATLTNCPELSGPLKKNESVKDLKFLGITKSKELKADYYIGASWYKENEFAFIVKPKVDVDYINLFITALEMNSDNEANYFSDYYFIDFEKPSIKVNTFDNVITPLLILHYLSLLSHLVLRGLKKGYITQEENLRSKIRGKILFQKHLAKNIFAKREERTYCRYQEFTEDIPENRLLKKAFVFSCQFINQFGSFKKHLNELRPKLATIKTAFENVSEDVSISQVNKINAGKIFRHYFSALKVAKLILRHFDYSIDNANGQIKSVQPFAIDMPRLYEMYVLSLLRRAYGSQIQFQVKGRGGTKVDYIKTGDEQLILDAKYKPRYSDSNNRVLDDIREISGYARDEKILNALKWDAVEKAGKGEFFPKCVIIYPNPSIKLAEEDGETEQDSDCNSVQAFDPKGIVVSGKLKQIPGFKEFYKIAVPLPKSDKKSQ